MRQAARDSLDIIAELITHLSTVTDLTLQNAPPTLLDLQSNGPTLATAFGYLRSTPAAKNIAKFLALVARAEDTTDSTPTA